MLYASFVLVAISSRFLPQAEAAVACNATHNPCEDLLWKGSQCRDGFCTNPFRGGCLRAMLGSDEYGGMYSSEDASTAESETLQALRRRLLSRPRVCNSEDAPDVLAQGLCVESDNEYTETRIYSQNWESAFVNAWIMQVIYSELLGVPSTIETGKADKNLNFYDETNRMEYGSSYSVSAIKNALKAEGGDCTIYNKGGDDQEYAPCAHLVMEIWNDRYDNVVESGAGEATKLVGMVGMLGWYITNFSLKEDPSLATHFGLSGEANRRKLAETFKRPTTWRDYCTLVSTNNCTADDDVAKRAPAADGSEDNRYFSPGLYKGHFRATEKPNKQSVNDSKPLALMIYSSFSFLALRFVMYVVSETASDDSQSMNASLQKARSLFCSLDSIANILIFFSRFFVANKNTGSRARPGSFSSYAENVARRDSQTVTMGSFTMWTLPSFRGSEISVIGGPSAVTSAVTYAEEEKLEEIEDVADEDGSDSKSKSTIRFRMEGRSIDMPKWAVEEFGSEVNMDETETDE